jgi:SAM-dependent methyltransferase
VEETFPREAAAHPEPFTGERLTSVLSGQTQIEHYHRYLFARALCRDLDTLDVASGEGYGAALLAQVARKVIGLEYSAATTRSAAMNFPRGNLTFAQGDARLLPLRDAAVDVVVSFETIEHFDRQAAFVAEVRRVLRPDGCFIVSTPDRDIYSAPGMAPNPFHVQEMTQPEFVALLHGQFRNVTIIRQQPVIGSVLLPESLSTARLLVFDRRGPDRFAAAAELPRAPYLLAVASNRDLPMLPASLFIDRSDLDSDSLALVQRSAELDQLTVELEQRTVELAERTAELAAVQADSVSESAATHAQITFLTHELVVARSSLRGFLRSYWPHLRRHLFGL